MSVIHLFFLYFMESSNMLCYANLKPFCTDVSKKKTLNDIQITVLNDTSVSKLIQNLKVWLVSRIQLAPDGRCHDSINMMAKIQIPVALLNSK